MIFSLFIVLAYPVSAHTTLQSSIVNWGEDIGWSIHESNHTNSTSLKFKFDSSDIFYTDTYKTLYRNGAAKWSSYGTISESTTAIGVVCTFSDSNSSIVGAYYNFTSDSSGHLTSWYIKINRAKSPTSVTVAHEFGHAYGLFDMYASSNSNKLMYGYESRTATSPSTSDGKGFKVITGAHATHTWAYKQVPWAPSSPLHRKYCTVCDGYKDASCSPSTGLCNICGYYH